MQWLLEDFLHQRKIRNLAQSYARRSKAKVWADACLKWHSESLSQSHRAWFLAYCYLQRENLNQHPLSERDPPPKQSGLSEKIFPMDAARGTQLPSRPLIQGPSPVVPRGLTSDPPTNLGWQWTFQKELFLLQIHSGVWKPYSLFLRMCSPALGSKSYAGKIAPVQTPACRSRRYIHWKV